MRRRETIVVALAAMILVGALTVHWWNAVTGPAALRREYERIHEGMTQAEVEAVMGGEGESRMMKISGSVEYWEYHGYPSTRRWEDAYATVDVVFSGSNRGPRVVTRIDWTPKDPPHLIVLWCQRVFLAALWFLALVLLVRGLRTPKVS